MTTARNATLTDLAKLLEDQAARKLDVVAGATQIDMRGGVLRVRNAEPAIDTDGVTLVDGLYRPTEVFDEGLASKLGIPPSYLRRLRAERPDIYDANVNRLLHGLRTRRVDGSTEVAHPADPRSFMLRLFRGWDEDEGVARAFLSDRYGIIDNLDALTAALAGVRQSGAEVQVTRCDLTERRMYVRIAAPGINMHAPELLAGYRSPFSGDSGTDNPNVFAGVVISNSEVGGGAFTITPQVIVQVCSNGLTIAKEAVRAVHLGGKLEEGTVKWSADTQRKQLELITARAGDSMRSFLDPAWMAAQVARLTGKATAPVTTDQVQVLSQRMAFSKEQTSEVLDFFVKGGQLTRGGFAQAVTAYAQTVADADTQYELETAAVASLDATV